MSRTIETLRRRDWLKLSAAGLLSGVSVPWFEAVAGTRRPAKSCILLWMDGGPSQQHTFDPKPGGDLASMETAVPGIRIVHHFPKLAESMADMVLVRSMSTEINGHYDAKYFLHTGYKRTTGLEHPAIGCIASSQISLPDHDMPGFVTIDAGYDRPDGGRLYRSVPSYVGFDHAPLAVNDPTVGLENLTPTRAGDVDARLALLAKSEGRFRRQLGLPAVLAKQAAFNRAVRLMKSPRATAFDLEREPESIRREYGDHKFGQSCLLARRLVEAGVSFVEIVHRGWDDHAGAAGPITKRAPWMDAGMGTLLQDLKRRGLLDETLVVWMGEFGRSPGAGKDHFSKAWTAILAGGGLNTGQVIGKTSEGGKNPGSEIVDRPVTSPDFVATICKAIGIDTHTEFLAPGARPMPVVDKNAKPIAEVLG